MKLPKDVENAATALATATKGRDPEAIERARRRHEARWQIHLAGLEDDLAAALEAHRKDTDNATAKRTYDAAKVALVEARAHYRAAEEKAGRREPNATTVAVGKGRAR